MSTEPKCGGRLIMMDAKGGECEPYLFKEDEKKLESESVFIVSRSHAPQAKACPPPRNNVLTIRCMR